MNISDISKNILIDDSTNSVGSIKITCKNSNIMPYEYQIDNDDKVYDVYRSDIDECNFHYKKYKLSLASLQFYKSVTYFISKDKELAKRVFSLIKFNSAFNCELRKNTYGVFYIWTSSEFNK